MLAHQETSNALRDKYLRRRAPDGFDHVCVEAAAFPFNPRHFAVDRYILTGKSADQNVRVARQ